MTYGTVLSDLVRQFSCTWYSDDYLFDRSVYKHTYCQIMFNQNRWYYWDSRWKYELTVTVRYTCDLPRGHRADRPTAEDVVTCTHTSQWKPTRGRSSGIFIRGCLSRKTLISHRNYVLDGGLSTSFKCTLRLRFNDHHGVDLVWTLFVVAL